MRLVWHADGLMEIDWLRHILGDLIRDEVIDLQFTCFDDDTIHVVSINTSPLPSLHRYFEECRSRCEHLVLLHLSDEYFSGGYSLYRYFDTVIRNNHTYLADAPGILTIPLGYANGSTSSDRPADTRPYVWSFVGQTKASRLAMIAAMETVQPSYVLKTPGLHDTSGQRLSKAEYNAILAGSIFAPCPMGNALLECWRMYEALEAGCIPLVEKRATIDYYRSLFGAHPIPEFRTWGDASRFIQQSVRDKQGLLDLQSKIAAWWASYKIKVHEQLRAVTSVSHATELQQYSNMFRNRYPFIHEPLRITELLRHQTGDSLRRRLMRPAGPLARIFRDNANYSSSKR